MNIPKHKKVIHILGVIFKTIFWICFSIGVVATALIVFYFFSVASQAPSVNLEKIKNPISTTIYDVDGNKLADVGVTRKYKDVTYDELPENLINAVISIEDRKFFTHDGYDVARVAGSTIKNFATHGDASQGAGGSTITQQVVKNTQNLRNGQLKIGYDDKIKEVVVANELEQKMSKQEILTAYLNTNYYYGIRIVGIRAAAKYYFNKDVSQLTLPESALLAGIPQAPSFYNPYAPFQNPKATPQEQAENQRVPFERYRMVLSSMYDAGYISKSEYDEAVKLPLSQLLKNGLPNADDSISAYRTAAIDEARQKLNLDENEAIPSGTKIYINVNKNLQELGNQIQDTNKFINFPSDNYDISFAVLENKTGRILAIGPGRGNNTLTNFNNATQGVRQPGSTIKPILDYAPAIEKFKWSSGKLLRDSPTNFIYSKTPIVNYDNRYRGVMTMTSAIADSRNVTAVMTYREVNKDTRDQQNTQNYSSKFVEKLGIKLSNDELVEPYAIGGFAHGVTTIQMASAFSAFGNDGKHAKANFVSKITDSDDKVLYEWTETADSVQAMSSETASIMTSALNYTIVSGGGSANNIPGLELAGKTGTSDDGRGNAKDHWFVGYSPDYTVAVWGGNKNQNNPVYYGYTNYIATIFKTLMKSVAKPGSKFKYSENTYLRGSDRYWKNYNNDGGILFDNGNPGSKTIPNNTDDEKEKEKENNDTNTPQEPAPGTTPNSGNSITDPVRPTQTGPSSGTTTGNGNTGNSGSPNPPTTGTTTI